MQCCNICVDNANKSRSMVYIVLCMYTLHIMIRLRCQRQFLTSFSSKTIKFLNCWVPLEAILLTGNLITGLNTTGIFSTDKVLLAGVPVLIVERERPLGHGQNANISYYGQNINYHLVFTNLE